MTPDSALGAFAATGAEDRGRILKEIDVDNKAIWGRKVATYDQSFNLYWGQTKHCFANLRAQKVSKFNLWSFSDSIVILQGTKK